MNRNRYFAIAAAAALLQATLAADVLVLRDGRRVEGTLVSVRGVTTVVPCLLNGDGCETSNVDAMLIVRFP